MSYFVRDDEIKVRILNPSTLIIYAGVGAMASTHKITHFNRSRSFKLNIIHQEAVSRATSVTINLGMFIKMVQIH